MLNWILGVIAAGLWTTAYVWYSWNDIVDAWRRRKARRDAKLPTILPPE